MTIIIGLWMSAFLPFAIPFITTDLGLWEAECTKRNGRLETFPKDLFLGPNNSIQVMVGVCLRETTIPT